MKIQNKNLVLIAIAIFGMQLGAMERPSEQQFALPMQQKTKSYPSLKLLSALQLCNQASEADVRSFALKQPEEIRNLIVCAQEWKKNGVQAGLNKAAELDMDCLHDFIERGADINWAQGKTALGVAAWNNNVTCAQKLLDMGADINAKDICEHTPLMCACMNGSTPMVNFLLANDAKINEKTRFDETALYFAARYNSYDIVQLLLRHNAEMNNRTYSGVNPLNAAILANNGQIVTMLLKAGADTSNFVGQNVLTYAIANDRPEMVQLLLDNNVRIEEADNQGRTAMHHIVFSSRLSIENKRGLIDSLLAKSPGIIHRRDFNGNTALHDAIINTDNNLSNTDNNLAVYLVSKGADINRTNRGGQTPLMHAIRTGNDFMTHFLLSRGAYTHLQDDHGDTALMYVLYNFNYRSRDKGNLDIVRSLLMLGADIWVENNNHRTPVSELEFIENQELKNIFHDYKQKLPFNQRVKVSWALLHPLVKINAISFSASIMACAVGVTAYTLYKKLISK